MLPPNISKYRVDEIDGVMTIVATERTEPMRTIEVKLLTYTELSDAAKEKARDWYREGNLDYDWWDSVYGDASAIGKLMVIDLDTKPVKLMGGGTRYDPGIWFTGFSSQGDGACFEGRYGYPSKAERTKDGRTRTSLALVKDYAPKDVELHEIALNLQRLQKANFYGITATVRHRGHYYHEQCTEIEVFDRHGNDADRDTTESCQEFLRDFMRWIYKALEREHDYQNSDEVVAENIIANEYEFNEDGSSA